MKKKIIKKKGERERERERERLHHPYKFVSLNNVRKKSRITSADSGAQKKKKRATEQPSNQPHTNIKIN